MVTVKSAGERGASRHPCSKGEIEFSVTQVYDFRKPAPILIQHRNAAIINSDQVFPSFVVRLFARSSTLLPLGPWNLFRIRKTTSFVDWPTVKFLSTTLSEILMIRAGPA